ncbi:response regulator transcription factor [Acidaminobacter sp. JC074]|uniref:response regulator transcription factor n=1 Tax=Acidaminobacter sp. JC074 TaxID=2530199 RepID=UPI001F112D22|nr:response regulator transcription factor [Acidaminobacter sp. JC074]MCH4886933.1 response regulator transcription factor [Acidaminobacter sp. JC074]
MNQILIVEDESHIREFIGLYYKAEGYQITEAEDGEEALDLFKKGNFDLIVLDIMMPKLDGYAVCKEIRSQSDVPIIILTAITTEESELKCYELGADDYVTKPLKGKTLIAKSKRMLDRYKASDIFTYESLSLDFKSRLLKLDGNNIDLTPKEYELLHHLIENKNIALSRESLLDAVWGYSFYGQTRVVDNHVKKLRKKLGDYAHLIQTVSKVGYRFQL